MRIRRIVVFQSVNDLALIRQSLLGQEQRALAEATHAFLARMEMANGIHYDEPSS